MTTFIPMASAARLPNPCSLLSNAQVAPTVGGTVQSRSFDRRYGQPTCTWTGPPTGYMQTGTTLTVQIFRLTKLEFNVKNLRSTPTPTLILGVAAPAYASPSGVDVWRAGIGIEMDGPWFTVYPRQAARLALTALKQS